MVTEALYEKWKTAANEDQAYIYLAAEGLLSFLQSNIFYAGTCTEHAYWLQAQSDTNQNRVLAELCATATLKNFNGAGYYSTSQFNKSYENYSGSKWTNARTGNKSGGLTSGISTFVWRISDLFGPNKCASLPDEEICNDENWRDCCSCTKAAQLEAEGKPVSEAAKNEYRSTLNYPTCSQDDTQEVCDYELDVKVPTACATTKSGKVSDKADWSCIFVSDNSSNDTSVQTNYKISGFSNDYCTIYCQEEINYNRVKAMFNSIYGMTVTNTIRNDVYYDNEKGWYEEELTNEKIIELLENEKKKGFLSFSTGVWVTAYARNNLLSNLVKLDKYQVYADTDSLKLLNGYDRKVIDDYNKKVVERIKYVSEILNIPYDKYCPKDIKGEEHLLGVFDCETKYGDYTYSKFITQGAKKYAVITKEKNKDTEKIEDVLKITVAGVPKKKGAQCIEKIEDFRDNLVFKSSVTGKQTLIYLDEQQENMLIDYQGNVYLNTDKTGCCLIPCSYELGKALDYANLISDESSKRAIFKEDL